MLIAFVDAGPHQYGPPQMFCARGGLRGLAQRDVHLPQPNHLCSYPEPGRSTLTKRKNTAH